MSSISIEASKNSDTEKFQENKIILIWSFTVWLVVMNTTMFNIALPSILTDLSLTSSTASWIVSGYSIVFAIATLTFSRLSDFIPISKLLIIGLFILGVASVIGFLANDFYVLLGARIFQAAGAGAVPGLAMVLAGRYIPQARRGKAMAFISSAASLGFGLGPVIGGLITQYLGWNFLFVVTGFVVLFIPLFQKLLPKEETEKGKFDIIGGVLTGLSVTGLLLFLSTFSYLILICSIVFIVLSWNHFHKIDAPFIQPKLLKNKQYMKLIFIGFIAFLIHFATLFLMPIILSVVFHKEPAEVGMLIFPGAIVSAITAQFIGSFIDRYGNIPLIIFGQSFLVIATLLFAFTSTIFTYSILFIYVFMSIGFSCINASVSNEVTRILVTDEIGTGMGMAQLIQFFGGALGVTLTGILLTMQKGMIPEIMYRNIFIGLFMLILCAILVFVWYLKSKNTN
ncbi:MFS transporter [Halalkalibacter nanhaiisediminis]|uniref:DHA2 family metal-tetracycline-proton antiporter-like MFS transporter n=1 Tax=Halalkalibacter nanhaiisediminis TaxID=688079 RepID=A0A562QQQ7_9BACI|nr:MFS transporter [Halalkalibacter nanhaiisediminis]TWI59091.1 DHA2 family metal-tetracycline-proton antiporter-like MFS transporter [Halalkalibacter nanhaiisediminis]